VFASFLTFATLTRRCIHFNDQPLPFGMILVF